MKKFTALVGALFLVCMSSMAVASAPAYEGNILLDETDTLDAPADVDSYNFRIRADEVGTYKAQVFSDDATNLVFGVAKKVGNTFTILGTGFNASDFTFFGEAGRYRAFVAGIGNMDQSYRFVISAVPEPEVWAMMLVGMGMVGLKLRRRDRSIVRPAA